MKAFIFSVSRKKIETVVARGGQADPDAPLDDASTRYRVSLGMEEDETWKSSTTASTTAAIQHSDALRVFGLGGPSLGTSVRSPDPMGLVREQLEAHSAAATPQAAAAPPTPSVAGSRASGQPQPSVVHCFVYILVLTFLVSRQSKGKGQEQACQCLAILRSGLGWQDSGRESCCCACGPQLQKHIGFYCKPACCQATRSRRS